MRERERVIRGGGKILMPTWVYVLALTPLPIISFLSLDRNSCGLEGIVRG